MSYVEFGYALQNTIMAALVFGAGLLVVLCVVHAAMKRAGRSVRCVG